MPQSTSIRGSVRPPVIPTVRLSVRPLHLIFGGFGELRSTAWPVLALVFYVHYEWNEMQVFYNFTDSFAVVTNCSSNELSIFTYFKISNTMSSVCSKLFYFLILFLFLSFLNLLHSHWQGHKNLIVSWSGLQDGFSHQLTRPYLTDGAVWVTSF